MRVSPEGMRGRAGKFGRAAGADVPLAARAHQNLSSGRRTRARLLGLTPPKRYGKFASNVFPARPVRPEAQDTALSRLKHGFESRTGRQQLRPDDCFFRASPRAPFGR